MSAHRRRVRFALMASSLGLVAAATLALFVGSSRIDAPSLWAALTGGDVSPTVRDVVFTVRVPRVLLGCLVGAALSVSGAVFQALLRNDLAEPYLIGVGPGALLGVTVAAVAFGASGSGAMPPGAIRSAGAFLGALAVAGVIFSFARRQSRSPTVSVLLAGIAIGAFVHAIATLLLHAAIEDWHHVVLWMLGDLSLAGYQDVVLLAVVLAACLLLVLWRARTLDVLTLGDEPAWHVGVSVRQSLWLLGGAACLLAAASVAQCGLVGFVGLVVPHIARGWIGPAHRALVVLCALVGAGLLVLADALARSLFVTASVPLGVVTAVLGAPVLAVLVARHR